jgi:hypothetical protein
MDEELQIVAGIVFAAIVAASWVVGCGPTAPDPCSAEAAAAVVARYAPRIRAECRKTGPCPPKDEAKAEIARLCP